MRITIRRRPPTGGRAPATHLIEIVTPRTNDATITPLENLLASLAPTGRFALEIAALDGRYRFFARATGAGAAAQLVDQFGAAYPQADLRPFAHSGEDFPAFGVEDYALDADGADADPAALGEDERAVACTLVLRDPPYLPLRPFRDADVDDERGAQADPLLGILGAIAHLPDGWRALCQLVVAPAPANWARPYRRLALERSPASEGGARHGDTSGTANAQLALPIMGMFALLGWHAYGWYLDGDWGRLAALVGVACAALVATVWLMRRLARRAVHDPRLVREKIARPARLAELRLAVYAPAGTPAGALRERLGRLIAAYGQFTHDEGNGLVPRPLRAARPDLRVLAPLAPRRRLALLNTRELATLWHLPQAGADVAHIERTTARQLLPLAHTVARGCPIGVAAHHGHRIPVAVPADTLRRHLLLVAKTQRGKSSLLLHLGRDAMTPPPPDGLASGLFLLDPHRGLARAALGLVPPARRGDLVFLDLGNAARPCGLNLVDAGLGWDRDTAVASTLTIFERQYKQFYGPRMEDCFRFGLLALFEANEALCAADRWRGRDRQHTILELPQLFIDLAFRKSILALARDPALKAWWEDFFDSALDKRLRLESANPVVTKINRFVGSHAASALVGQPRSTIDPAAWVRDGALVIVDGAKGTLGESTCALLGGTLLNLATLAIGAQASLPRAERRPVRLIVDEFQSFPGADYEALLSEHAKCGASLALATQSLARLDAKDRERALRSTVFANIDGLFAFNCSAEDADYLVPELGGPLTPEDLTSLGEHRCYARLSSRGERLPAFSVRLHPAPAGDPALADALAATAAARWGRPRAAVEAWYADARARIAALGTVAETKTVIGESGTGLRPDSQRPQPEATPPKALEPRAGKGRRGGRERPGREAPPAAPPQQGRLPEVRTTPPGEMTDPAAGQRAAAGEQPDEAAP